VETDIGARVAGHPLRLVCASIFRQLSDRFPPEGMETETLVVDPGCDRRRSQKCWLIIRSISAEERMVRDTTITMSRQLHKRLKKIADDRNTSMNILVNTALAHWLASKGALRVG
jgi:hypothetical protein